MIAHALSAALTLWGHQAQLPGSVPYARKYALSITGTPGTTVRLASGKLPADWAASFCTARLCALGKVTITIPASGHFKTEFQIVPDDRTHLLAPHITVTGTAQGLSFRLERISLPSDSR